jgi:PAS domain S-box-containing protein
MAAKVAQAPFESADYVDLFFDLFETSSDAVFITRADDGVMLAANETALSLFGLDTTSAYGRSTIDLGIWQRPADRTEFVTALRGTGRVRRYPVQFRNRCREAFTLELSATVAHLRGEDVILGVGALEQDRLVATYP